MNSNGNLRWFGAVLIACCAATAVGACYDIVLKNEFFPPGACDQTEVVGAECGICPNYSDWDMENPSGSYCKSPTNGPPSSMVCELGEVKFDQQGKCMCMPIPGNQWRTYYVGAPVCGQICDSDTPP